MLILIIFQHVRMGLHLLKISLLMCSIHMIPNNILFALDHVKMNDRKLVGLMHVFSRRSRPIQDRLVINCLILFIYYSLISLLLRLLLLLLLLLLPYPHSIYTLMTRQYSLIRKKNDVWTLSIFYTRRYLAGNIYIYIYNMVRARQEIMDQ